MWAAVMIQAITDIVSRPIKKADREEWFGFRASAMAWVRSASEQPTSFGWVCRMLDLDPDRMRSQIIESKNDVLFLQELRKRAGAGRGHRPIRDDEDA